MRKSFLALLLAFGFSDAGGQPNISKKSLTISSFAKVFYACDFANPANHIKQPFLHTYNRPNTFNLNLGMIKANYDNGHVRANVALMADTYTNDNITAEYGILKNIYEANAAQKFQKQKTFG